MASLVLVKTSDNSPLPCEFTPDYVIELCGHHSVELVAEERFPYNQGALRWLFVLKAPVSVGADHVQIDLSPFCVLVLEKIDELVGNFDYFCGDASLASLLSPEQFHSFDGDLSAMSSKMSVSEDADIPGVTLDSSDESEEDGDAGSTDDDEDEPPGLTRPQDHFWGSDLDLICEIIVLRIHDLVHRVIESADFCPQSTEGVEAYKLLKDLVLRLGERLKLEHYLIQIHDLCPTSVQKFMRDINICFGYGNSEDCFEAKFNVIDRADEWRKLVCPLDFGLLHEYLRESFRAARKVQGKKVCLLVGPSGVGKSTLVHILTGAHVETLVTADGTVVSSITPSELCEVIGVGTSGEYSSMTRYINSVMIPKSALRAMGVDDPLEDLIIIDCAGFKDTHGAEIDISNSFGIVRAAQVCSSAKILLVSDNQVGSRGEAFKESVLTLSQMLGNNLCKYHTSITSVFTKFNEEKSVLEHLKRALAASKREESDYRKFISILNEQQAGRPLLVRPNVDKPCVILKRVLNSVEITNPHQVFQNFFSAASEERFRAQLRNFEGCIKVSLVANELRVVSMKMKELHDINILFSTNLGVDAESNAQELINMELKQRICRFNEQLTLLFSRQFKFSQDEMVEFSKVCEALVAFQSLKEFISNSDYLNSCFKDIDALTYNLFTEFDKYANIYDNAHGEDPTSFCWLHGKLIIPLESGGLSVLKANIQSVAALGKVIEGISILRSTKNGKLLQYNRQQHEIMQDRLNVVVETVCEATRSPHESLFYLVDAFSVLKRIEREVGEFLSEESRHLIETSCSEFCCFTPFVNQVEAILSQPPSSIDQASLKNAVDAYTLLLRAPQAYPKLATVLDMQRFESMRSGLVHRFSTLGSNLLGLLLDNIPKSIVKADYHTIFHYIGLLEPMREHCDLTDSWINEFNQHLDTCSALILVEFERLTIGGTEELNVEGVLIVLENLVCSEQMLTHTAADLVARVRLPIRQVFDAIAKFISHLECLMTASTAGGECKISVDDIRAMAKLSLLSCEGSKLRDGVEANRSLKVVNPIGSFADKLYELSQFYEHMVIRVFQSKCAMLLEQSPVGLGREVLELSILICVLNKIPNRPVLTNLSHSLYSMLSEYGTSFQQKMLEELNKAWTLLSNLDVSVDELDQQYVDGSSTVACDLMAIESMYEEFQPQGASGFTIYMGLYSSFPRSILEEYLGGEGRVLCLFRRAQILVGECVSAKKFDAMKHISTVVRGLGTLDKVVMNSKFNPIKQFDGFLGLGDQLYGSILSSIDDAKSSITESLHHKRLEETAKLLKEHNDKLSSTDFEEITGAIKNTQQRIENQLQKELHQASNVNFSIPNFLRLQTIYGEWKAFAELKKSMRTSMPTAHLVQSTKCKQLEVKLQDYFVKKYEDAYSRFHREANLFELEMLMKSCNDVIFHILPMQCWLLITDFQSIKGVRVNDGFSSAVESMLGNCRLSVDQLFAQLSHRAVELPVSQYSAIPPVHFQQMLLRCIDIDPSYRATHDAVTDSIVNKLLDLLARSQVASDPDYVTLAVFEKRVHQVAKVQPYVSTDAFAKIQCRLSECENCITQEKAYRENEIAQFQDLQSIVTNIGIFEQQIVKKYFDYAKKTKKIIIDILQKNFGKCKKAVVNGSLLDTIELAAIVWATTNQVIATIQRCQSRCSTPIQKIVTVHKQKVARSSLERYYYIDWGEWIFLKPDDITPHVKLAMQWTITKKSDAERHPEVFTFPELTNGLADMRLLLNKHLITAIRNLESVSVESVDSVEISLSVLLKFIELRTSVQSYFNEVTVESLPAIGAAFQNFHNLLTVLLERLNEAVRTASVPAIKFMLDLLRKIERTIESWILFSNSTYCRANFVFGDAQYNRLMYSSVKSKMNITIMEWCSRLESEQYMNHPETTTRNNADRDAFYSTVNTYFKAIMTIDLLADHHSIHLPNELKNRCQAHLKRQIISFSVQLQQLIERLPTREDSIYVDCCNFFDNLRSIEEKLEFPAVKLEVRRYIALVYDTLNKKFKSLQDGITLINQKVISEVSVQDLDDCIDRLIDLKRMSNRLVCFSGMIDSLIDDSTAILQRDHQGARRFGMITHRLKTRLQSHEISEHIRALLQHKAFDEITNILRVRRTKTFTIYNVLGFQNRKETEGVESVHLLDDLSPTRDAIQGEDITFQTRVNLFHHWKEFDSMYWRLVRDGIDSSNRSKYIQHLVDGVVSRVIVGQYPTEQIRFRIILAHLFAFWTLSRYSGSYDHTKTRLAATSQSNNNPTTPVTTNNSNNNNSSSSSSSVTGEGSNSNSNDPVEHWTDILTQPHPAQVVALFRLFGIENDHYDESLSAVNVISSDVCDMESNVSRAPAANSYTTTATALQPYKFLKQFVEILTGEGKSVVLAVASTLMALLGYSVHCACYSAYLSRRDQEEFKMLFEGFRVTQYIEYGTFGALCEKILDAKGNIRSMVQSLLVGKSYSRNPKTAAEIEIASRPRALLIDEVDVFFSKEYFGQMYEPYATIEKESLANMALWLWQHRKENLTWKTVMASQAFKDCQREMQTEFLDNRDMAAEIVKGMLLDLQTVTSDNFVVDYAVAKVNDVDQIVYKEQDGVNANIIKGYQTMFHYMKAHDEKQVTAATMRRALVGRIYSGGFSYAEIPKLYDCLMGVTGTLKQVLKGPQKKLLDMYQIQRYTHIPSVYGKSNRQFRGNTDVFLVENAAYFSRIVREIEDRLRCVRGTKYHRAVLVFFESMNVLDDFHSSTEFATYRRHALVINETTSASAKSCLIRAATSSGQIVLLTKVMGRGADFICFDDNLLASGGVHVLQTFFSEQESEEVQLQGRTGRQGNSGSYSLLLKKDDLQKFGLTLERLKELEDNGTLYGPLAAQRDSYFKNLIYPQLENGIDRIAGLFVESQAFVECLRDRKARGSAAKQFLLRYNKVEITQGGNRGKFKVMIMMDATGSMGPFLRMAKNSVKSMFERLYEFVRAHDIEADIFVQYVAYRNYNAPPTKLLEVSPWEPLSTHPQRLFSFIDSVDACYGINNEAAEVALQHANAEDRIEPINAVIWIGDVPPNTKEGISKARALRKGDWVGTRFQTETYYEEELARFRPDIPVHCFYLTSSPKQVFDSVALRTNGTSQALNVNAADSTQKLCDCVSLHITRAVGGQKLVDIFRRQYDVDSGYIG